MVPGLWSRTLNSTLVPLKRRGEVVRAQGVLGLIKDQEREERGRKMTVGTSVPELCHLYQNEEQLHV